jgi:ABC-type Fe3+ transport system permease subunit
VGAYDRFLNVQVVALIVLQLALCIALAVASYAFRREQRGAFYFEWTASGTGKSGNNAGNGFVFGSISFLTFWYVPGGALLVVSLNHGDEENTTHVTIHGGGEIPTAWTDETQGRNLVSRSHGQGCCC